MCGDGDLEVESGQLLKRGKTRDVERSNNRTSHRTGEARSCLFPRPGHTLFLFSARPLTHSLFNARFLPTVLRLCHAAVDVNPGLSDFRTIITLHPVLAGCSG